MISDALDSKKQSEQEQEDSRQQESRFNSPSRFIRNKIKKKVTSKIKKKATEKIIKELSKKLSEQALKQVISVAGKTPWGLVIILILLLILVIVYMFFPGADISKGISQDEETPVIGDGTTEPVVEGLNLSKTGESEVSFGETITYTINASYDESTGVSGGKIVLVDKLPVSTEFVSATGTYTQTGGTIEWPLSDGIQSYTFTLVVRPTSDNVEISNTVFGRSLAAQSRLLDSSASNLNAIFADAASAANVPEALLRAIAKTESGVLGYSSDEVSQFNTDSWWSGLADDAPTLSSLPALIRRGYAYNTCAFPKDNPICPGADVRGAMQFELGTWNGISGSLSFADGHTPDRRYVRDVVYGAAYFIRGKIDQYNSRFGFTQNLSSLSETQVKALARSYCGGNPDANTNQAACGFGAHEASVWAYYQEYNN